MNNTNKFRAECRKLYLVAANYLKGGFPFDTTLMKYLQNLHREKCTLESTASVISHIVLKVTNFVNNCLFVSNCVSFWYPIFQYPAKFESSGKHINSKIFPHIFYFRIHGTIFFGKVVHCSTL